MSLLIGILKKTFGAVVIRNSTRNTFVIVLTLLASNLVINTLVIAAVTKTDVSSYKPMVYAYHGLTVLLAFLLLFLKGSERLPSLRVYHLLIAFVLVEVGIRVAIVNPWKPLPVLSNPSLYFSPADTRYWVVLHYQKRSKWINEELLHPEYGWVASKNELNILTDRFYSMEAIQGRPVLFFGDSYVAGTTHSMEERLPQQLQHLLPDNSVLNFGVFGYGVGQTVMRFIGEYPRFQHLRPKVLIGVTLTDLQRSMVDFRQVPKPCYVKGTDGKLERKPVRHAGTEEFLDNYSFGATSFVFSFLTKSLAMVTKQYTRCNARCHDLNRRIIEHALDFIGENQVDAQFVIFYQSEETLIETDEERVVRKIFYNDLGIGNRVIDTKEVIEEHLRTKGMKPEELHLAPDDTHYGLEGNRLLAEYIRERIIL